MVHKSGAAITGSAQAISPTCDAFECWHGVFVSAHSPELTRAFLRSTSQHSADQREHVDNVNMCILQPGVASVYCAIVQQTRDGCEFYIKDFPELAGCSYSEARRRLPDAVLYG